MTNYRLDKMERHFADGYGHHEEGSRAVEQTVETFTWTRRAGIYFCREADYRIIRKPFAGKWNCWQPQRRQGDETWKTIRVYCPLLAEAKEECLKNFLEEQSGP